MRRQLNGIKIMSATVSRDADRWLVSITVDTPDRLSLPQTENQGAVGVDLGVSARATRSTGESIAGPKAHKALLCRLQRLSRGLSCKAKGSENRKKAKVRLSRLHARIGNIRKEGLHQLTIDLTRRFDTLGIEDLNVKGRVKNRHLSRAVSDRGFFEFRRQLDYKAAQRGGMIVVADRWYPSSKTCSACGHKRETLPLSVREWLCPACGSKHDRDVNAAINLRNWAVSLGGEFHRVSLRRGRLWLWSQDQNKTGLGEAGIQQQSTLWGALRRYGRTAKPFCRLTYHRYG